MKRSKLTGMIFGRLKVLRFFGCPKGHSRWECVCQCGNKTIVQAGNLKSGQTRSCGCLVSETTRKRCVKKSETASFNLLFNDYKRHAKRKNIAFDLSENEFRKLTKSICYYCGISSKQISNPSKKSNGHYLYNGIDRLNPKIGYITANCVAACKNCNYAKNNQDYRNFMVWLKRIYKHSQGQQNKGDDERLKMNIDELWEKREKEALEVQSAFEEAEQKRAIFLEKYGWVYTYEFPDSIWRFVKKIKGQNVCLNAQDAFNMERNFIKPEDTGIGEI